MGSLTGAARIVSMDQFRGYTVAGMFVVNFLGGLHAIHPVMQHHNTYFSYADSIMPSFLFAAGFAYRLTMLRRLQQIGRWAAYRHAMVRSFALLFLTVIFFGCGAAFTSWDEMTAFNVREFAAKLLKANLWEVLAIIGAAQLLILPVIAAPPWTRIGTMLVFLGLHLMLSYAFNYEFVYGRPNALDAYWGAAGTRAWDGGFFGVLAWSVPLLGGTLAYDFCAAHPAGIGAIRRLAAWGMGLMLLGYLLSCLTTLYDIELFDPPISGTVSPVWPSWDELGKRTPASLLADPPFVTPPPPAQRIPNYWMMDKRVVTVSFTLFSTGFAFALFSLFVGACDRGGRQGEGFRMLGQNPLAAYLLQFPVEKTVRALVPADAPLWWCLLGLGVFLAINIWLVRYLDQHKIYLRL